MACKLSGNSPVPNKTPSFGPVASARGLSEVPNRPPATRCFRRGSKQQRTCPKIRVIFESKRCFSRMVDSLKHICHIISSQVHCSCYSPLFVWIPISIKVPESHDAQIQCHSPSSKVPILPADLSPCFPGSP